MQAFMPQLPHSAALPPERKPLIISFDSAAECSLEHWLLVCRLVDEQDKPDGQAPDWN